MWSLSRKKKSAPRTKLEKAILGALTPAYDLHQPSLQTTPLILASPHSGRRYPDEFQALTKLGLAQLRLGEDCYIDRIFKPLSACGIPFLCANFPRSYVDVNRRADEWPPETRAQIEKHPFEISPRARTGLGVVPTRISQDLDIYDHVLSPKHIQERLNHLYHPYHQALSRLIKSTHAQFGTAVLLDCHSMPGRLQSGAKRADFILGDRYGESCRPSTITHLETALQALGYSVTRNIPYAGGFITSHYGRPHRGVETLQIEINKDLYLNPHTLEPHSGMGELIGNLEKTVSSLANHLRPAINIAAQ